MVAEYEFGVKIRNGWSNKVTKYFEKSNEFAGLDENWYQGVIWVVEYEFEGKILNSEMADPIWRIKIWKNIMNWWISMRVGTKGFYGSLKTYLMSILNLKFVFSDPNNPLVPIFIQICQLNEFYNDYRRHPQWRD